MFPLFFYCVWAKAIYTSSHADTGAFSDPISSTIHLWIMNLPYISFCFIVLVTMNIGRSSILTLDLWALSHGSWTLHAIATPHLVYEFSCYISFTELGIHVL